VGRDLNSEAVGRLAVVIARLMVQQVLAVGMMMRVKDGDEKLLKNLSSVRPLFMTPDVVFE
jgi:hypothetical protein